MMPQLQILFLIASHMFISPNNNAAGWKPFSRTRPSMLSNQGCRIYVKFWVRCLCVKSLFIYLHNHLPKRTSLKIVKSLIFKLPLGKDCLTMSKFTKWYLKLSPKTPTILCMTSNLVAAEQGMGINLPTLVRDLAFNHKVL